MSSPNISIVIPSYIKTQSLFEITKKALDGLYKTSGIQDHEIILIDDCSEKRYITFLRKLFPQIQIVSNSSNLGFARSINAGINKSKNEFILLLNNDVEIQDPNWLNQMCQIMTHNNWDLTAARQSFLDADWQYVPEKDRIKKKVKLFSYLEFWCALIKRQVFQEVGLIPTNFFSGFWEDNLFCWHIQKNTNFKMGVAEGLGIKHLYHTTFKSEGFNLTKEYNEKRQIFLDVLVGKIQPIFPKLER